MRVRSLAFPLSLLIAWAVTLPASLPGAERRSLRVAADHHHLEFSDGAPFFFLGDTAWTLLSRLTSEEAGVYLSNRAAKGFTVIQAVVLAPEEGLTVPNAQGDLPLVGQNLAQPNETYFVHVDAILRQAAALGLQVGLLPAWGHYWKQTDGKYPGLFTVEKARGFGLFLGRRYRELPVIWILGGDQDVSSPADRAVIDALAAGLRDGDGGTHLITYHPRGPGLSSDRLGDAPWLDFNMVQSSHGAHDHDNGLYAEHDYALSPPRPTLDGESRYETMPVGFYFQDASRLDRFDDYDVRQAAYWAVFAGACGHTYGNNNVWQFWRPPLAPVLWANQRWSDSLDTAGAFQMGYLRRLCESRPFNQMAPAPALVRDAPATGGAKVRALISRDGACAFIYSPRGENFTVDKSLLKAARMREIWYDPRYGVSYLIHKTDTHGFQTFTPPTTGRGQDWVLIIEDAAQNWPLPGT